MLLRGFAQSKLLSGVRTSCSVRVFAHSVSERRSNLVQQTTRKSRRRVSARVRVKPAVVVCVPTVSEGEMGMSVGLDKLLGTLAEIVEEGDSVGEFETVAVIDTDKAAIEVRTPIAGVVRRRLMKLGAGAHEGEAVLEVTPHDASCGEVPRRLG